MVKVLEFKICEPIKKYNIDNPHDKLFKDLLSDIEEFKKFVTNYVGIDILKEKVEKSNTEYITSSYRKYQSDIVYKIRGKEVYLLLEHQSTIDKNMPYRMLNYYIRKLEEIKKENIDDIEKEPLIIPIVLYTGDNKWNVSKQYGEEITKYEKLNKYLEMKYELVDINQYTEKDLLEDNSIISYAMLIEKNRGKQTLLELLEKISIKCDTNYKREKMQNIINYILEPILQEDTGEIIKKFKQKEEELDMKTAQDYIREEIRELKRKAIEEGRAEGKAIGIEEGIKEGKKKGIEEGIKEGIKEGSYRKEKQIIINMIKEKVELSKIREYTGVNEEKIKKIAEKVIA